MITMQASLRIETLSCSKKLDSKIPSTKKASHHKDVKVIGERRVRRLAAHAARLALHEKNDARLPLRPKNTHSIYKKQQPVLVLDFPEIKWIDDVVNRIEAPVRGYRGASGDFRSDSGKLHARDFMNMPLKNERQIFGKCLLRSLAIRGNLADINNDSSTEAFLETLTT
jgi:hypothetical protein